MIFTVKIAEIAIKNSRNFLNPPPHKTTELL